MTELQAALQLYEQSKDPIGSLAQCRQVWRNATANANHDDDSKKEPRALESWTQSHNEGILHHLSALRRRRRVRARPSSKDDDGDHVDDDAGDSNQPPSDLMAVVSKNVKDLPIFLSDEGRHDDGNREYIDSNNNYNASLVATYNLGLVHYSSGDIDEALHVVLPTVNDVMMRMSAKQQEISEDSSNRSNDNLDRVQVVIVRLLFLVLDCVIRKHEGDGIGIQSLTFEVDGETEMKDPHDVIAWIENNMNTLTGFGSNSGESSSIGRINEDELKFRLHIYKSKFLFIGSRRDSTQKDDDDDDDDNDLATRTRISRKELKSAMDLYQNKLSIEKAMDHDNKYNNNYNDGSYMEKTKSTGRQTSNKGGGGGGGSKPTKSKGSNTSDVSSVTSMAGGSFVSEGVLWNTNNSSGGAASAGIVASATFEDMPHKTPQTITTNPSQQQQPKQQAAKKKDHPELHAQHEAVLYLKANLECLRGNTTKSLKLCSEARLAGRRSHAVQAHDDKKPTLAAAAAGNIFETDQEDGLHNNSAGEDEPKNIISSQSIEDEMANYYDEAIYYNNLALVHQSAGKFYLALHYSSLALEFVSKVTVLDNGNEEGSSNPSYFWSDGIARPDITADILYNTSTCALRVGQFEKAHECMVKCIDLSPNLLAKRPRSWLNLGQSSIGEKLVSPFI